MPRRICLWCQDPLIIRCKNTFPSPKKRGGGSTTWDSYGCDQDKVTTSGQCPKSGDGTPGWSHAHYSNVPDSVGCDVECSSSSNKECCHAMFMVDNWTVMTNGCSFTVYNMSVETSAQLCNRRWTEYLSRRWQYQSKTNLFKNERLKWGDGSVRFMDVPYAIH